MLKERVDSLIDILAEQYAKIENTLLIRNNQQLVKFLENPEKWKSEQLASAVRYKKELASDTMNKLKILNDQTAKVVILAYKEIDKDAVKMEGKELVVSKFQKEIKQSIANAQKHNEKMLKELANSSFLVWQHTVKVISSTYKTDKIFEGIKAQMPKGVQNGLKVVYKNGAKMNWKSYMEMNARTTIQQETTQKQIDIGAETNQYFVICDSFGDCAKDHANYQGKVYYNAKCNLTKEVEDYIKANQILSMQEVSEKPPYLKTRPNCRHNFHPIPTSEVLGNKANQYLQREGLKFGDYKETNYAKLQEQRYNERQIRKWKERAENERQLQKTTGLRNEFAITKTENKVKEWQKRQRELIRENPDILKRQYERENPRIVVEDLGVRYRYKVEDGELVKK